MRKPRLGKKGRKALAAKKAAPKKKAAAKKYLHKDVPQEAPEQEQPAEHPQAQAESDCCNRNSAGETHAPGCVSGLGGTTPEPGPEFNPA